jgi:hypothetical protein
MIELQCLDAAMQWIGGGGGGQWGIGGNITRTNQKDECTGHLFSALVHYVIGNKNGWFLVSRLLNVFKPFLPPSNSEKANRSCLLIVISES